jgi:hypothetical protein
MIASPARAAIPWAAVGLNRRTSASARSALSVPGLGGTSPTPTRGERCAAPKTRAPSTAFLHATGNASKIGQGKHCVKNRECSPKNSRAPAEKFGTYTVMTPRVRGAYQTHSSSAASSATAG